MKTEPITVYLPDSRDVRLGRYGLGNFKIGLYPGVFTYSRLADRTCPGASKECLDICYAKRIDGPVSQVYRDNSLTHQQAMHLGRELVPPIPTDCRFLRIHVSGDFDSVEYIDAWRERLLARPDVKAWAYTRSWRVPHLLDALETLRASCANLQLFASLDPSENDLPPVSWRRAWILRYEAHNGWPTEARVGLYRTCVKNGVDAHDQESVIGSSRLSAEVQADKTPVYICPEETGHKRDCVSCAYCFAGRKHDVAFIEHHGA